MQTPPLRVAFAFLGPSVAGLVASRDATDSWGSEGRVTWAEGGLQEDGGQRGDFCVAIRRSGKRIGAPVIARLRCMLTSRGALGKTGRPGTARVEPLRMGCAVRILAAWDS